MRIKNLVFSVVCIFGILGGIFAVRVLNNRSTPPEVFWLVIGGGCAVVSLTFLLAEGFGYVRLPDISQPSKQNEAATNLYEQQVLRDAKIEVAFRDDPNVM